jgi:hypothetical protein
MPETLSESAKIQEPAGSNRPLEPTLTEMEVARLLQVPQRVVARMRRRGEGPAYLQCCGFIRYPRQSVVEFLDCRPIRKKTPVV